MADFNGIKAEIDADPLTRGYAGMTDVQVADDMNTVYRDGTADAGALFTYLAQQKAREDPAEGTASHIYGRLKRAAQGALGAETFYVGGANLTSNRKDGCATLLHMTEGDRLGAASEVMTKAEITDILDEVIAAGVMKPADRTAIIGLSQNKQSRASELGLGRVRTGNVTTARAM